MASPIRKPASDGQLGIPPPQAHAVDNNADIWADDGRVAREAGDGAEEVAKEDEDAPELDAEADEGPAKEDKGDAGEEGGRALCFLLAREEEERLLRADDDC